MYKELNQVDLAFVVDTTGSMGSLIAEARRQMVDMLHQLAVSADIGLQLGIVEYRDHPDQAKIVYRVYPFTANLEKAQQTIESLQVDDGGDFPEAVLDGIVAACRELSWRPHALRLLILVGDAPPHGVGAAGDAFPAGCPCGETIASVTRQAEEMRITIHALGLTQHVTSSFKELSALTGGRFFESQEVKKAIEHIAELLKMEFAELELDRQILTQYHKLSVLDAEALAQRLEVPYHVASNSLVRLLSRDLIVAPVLEA